MYRLLFIACLIHVFTSCSVEKRLYNPGWNVDRIKRYTWSAPNKNNLDSREKQNKPFHVVSSIYREENKRITPRLIEDEIESGAIPDSLICCSDQTVINFRVDEQSSNSTMIMRVQLQNFKHKTLKPDTIHKNAKVNVHRDNVYFVLMILGALGLLALLLFSTGIWLKITAIMIFLLLLSLLIALIVIFLKVIDFVLFGWWMG